MLTTGSTPAASLMVGNNSNPPQQLNTVWVVPHNADHAKLFPLPVSQTDRIMNFSVDVSHFVPGRFNNERLISALRDTLKYCQHVTARLRIKGDDWWLDAGNRGIPVGFQTTEEPLNHHPDLSVTPTEIIDSLPAVDISRAHEPDWDEPMLKIKVTYCSKTNESVIGLSYSHILGDGDLIVTFLGAWSQYYQGKEPFLGRPTYERYQSPQPPAEFNNNPETDAFIKRHLKHLIKIPPREQWMEMFLAAQKWTTSVDLFFSGQQIEQLRYIADFCTDRAAKRTTQQDALGAYLITTLNRCLDVPITCVMTTVTSRGIKNPDNIKPGDWCAPGYFAAGNNIIQVYTPSLSINEASSIGAVAAAMRNSVREARQYEHAKRIFAISESIALRIANEKTFYKFWDDGIFCWNAMGTGRSDGDVFHFGFGHARLNTYGSSATDARCFQAPTVRQLDGSWVRKADGLIMWTHVPTKIHQKFMAMIAADFNTSTFPNNIAAREWKVQESILGAQEARL
ncbi:hypothetical protein FB45DRAFT_1064117 [Roridomyces roridus]|uniref:Uncharacterized protein n=1 Tax=Roridomyces roridus TaxID=1738132 RepID=A0AAD7FCM7_9AGAR|nr:hypothetical protein FB45DRAFT_1064117 [Roridomyces roridus]